MTSAADHTFEPTLLLGGERQVPRVGYGAMQLAGPGVIGLPEDISGALEVLATAVELGVRFFDTANAYGPRTVNQLIGRALSPLAEDVVIGNKVGAARGPAGEWLTDSRPETIRGQVEDALFDMRTDASALTYLRLWGDSPDVAIPPAQRIPLEDSLGALVELRDEGKVRHIGVSGASPEMLAQAQAITPIAAVQNRFNLVDRSGVEVLDACERDQIAFVPYFPLATGGLSELPALSGPAGRLDVSGATIALAWLLRRSPVILPIPGTTSTGHLRANLEALDVAPQLTDAEVRELTVVQDESAAELGTMPARMIEAVQRRISR